MDEVWKPVQGYEEAYEVSNLGRVRSVDRIVLTVDGHERLMTGRMLAASPNTVGDLTVVFSQHGKNKSYTVKKLVMEAFRTPEMVVEPTIRYLNGDASNAAFHNLYYAPWGAAPTERNHHG